VVSIECLAELSLGYMGFLSSSSVFSGRVVSLLEILSLLMDYFIEDSEDLMGTYKYGRVTPEPSC